MLTTPVEILQGYGLQKAQQQLLKLMFSLMVPAAILNYVAHQYVAREKDLGLIFQKMFSYASKGFIEVTRM